MATATETLTNGQAAAVNATKAAAETVAKATTRATSKATRTAVDNATNAFDSAAKAVKSAQENGADVSAVTAAAVTEAANTTVEAFTKATEASVEHATAAFEVAAEAVKSAGTTADPKVVQAKTQEFVDGFAAQSKQGALVWLDAYDKAFGAFLQLHTQIAQATKVEAYAELVSSTVGALQQLSATYVGTVRDLLK